MISKLILFCYNYTLSFLLLDKNIYFFIQGYEGSPMDVEPQHRPMKQHNQCYRLYHCIQAAVAKIAEKDVTKKEWTAHHIRILLDLIPQNPQFPLG